MAASSNQERRAQRVSRFVDLRKHPGSQDELRRWLARACSCCAGDPAHGRRSWRRGWLVGRRFVVSSSSAWRASSYRASPSARETRSTASHVGLATPRSRPRIEVASRPVASARASCVSPISSRRRRIARPRATCGVRLIRTPEPSVAGTSLTKEHVPACLAIRHRVSAHGKRRHQSCLDAHPGGLPALSSQRPSSSRTQKCRCGLRRRSDCALLIPPGFSEFYDLRASGRELPGGSSDVRRLDRCVLALMEGAPVLSPRNFWNMARNMTGVTPATQRT